MKVFLTRDALRKGIIEAEGNILTGHPDQIQVNGIPPSSFNQKRIYHKGEWFTTLEEAQSTALINLDRLKESLDRELERVAETKLQIEKMRKTIKNQR